MTLDAHIARLEAKAAALCEQVTALTGRMWGVEARLVNDSYKSGTPPSSDGLTQVRDATVARRQILRLPNKTHLLGHLAVAAAHAHSGLQRQ